MLKHTNAPQGESFLNNTSLLQKARQRRLRALQVSEATYTNVFACSLG